MQFCGQVLHYLFAGYVCGGANALAMPSEKRHDPAMTALLAAGGHTGYMMKANWTRLNLASNISESLVVHWNWGLDPTSNPPKGYTASSAMPAAVGDDVCMTCSGEPSGMPRCMTHTHS